MGLGFRGLTQRAFGTISPERLDALKRMVTVGSICSSTRIEGSKLADREMERLHLAKVRWPRKWSQREVGAFGLPARRFASANPATATATATLVVPPGVRMHQASISF